MRVYVPARYIADAKIDFGAETLACLGVPLVLRSGRRSLHLPPVTLGVMSVLEALACRFIPDPLGCDTEAVFTAAAVNLAGRDSRRFITEPVRLARQVRQIRKKYGPAIIENYRDFLRHFHETPFNGFGMIKKKGSPSSEPWWYGATALAALVNGAGNSAGYDADGAIWDLPLVLAGHIVAAKAASMDELAVGRPKNEADIKIQLDAAIKRELAGELHPWQIDLPEDYEPSECQKKARPAVVEEHAAMKAARKGK